jgi:hypothetical protein
MKFQIPFFVSLSYCLLSNFHIGNRDKPSRKDREGEVFCLTIIVAILKPTRKATSVDPTIKKASLSGIYSSLDFLIPHALRSADKRRLRGALQWRLVEKAIEKGGHKHPSAM